MSASPTKVTRRVVAVLSLLAGLTGCQVGTFEDVSKRPDVAPFQGVRVTLRDDLIAIGVTHDQNYRGGIDVIHLVPSPGIGGPEVKAQATIGAGTTVTIGGALTLRSFLPGERLFFVVSGLRCSFCAQARVIVGAASNGGKPVLPDYLIAEPPSSAGGAAGK